ncbi:uncharacterized protein LOC131933796 [Physella acuta]|uniref:uncharacterized protein LOC131933796 n=1 Tax=Physella acuta TaxID=109671 RepID=UPI0027DDCAF4|nr:uncharacterized protein LOC131933796 [Physella acuta]
MSEQEDGCSETDSIYLKDSKAVSGHENLTSENEDFCTESQTHSEREQFDGSSDESQKNYEQVGSHKSGKKFKPKVKIKTLTIDGQLVYFCKICDKIFTRRKDKLNHELAHSGESVLTCTECGKEYLHESSLASHMRTHDGDPLYMCDLCPKMFAQSHHLKTHILSHSEPTNFVCKTCFKEFATTSDLNHHCRVQIKHEMTQLWCKMCKVFLCRHHDLVTEKRLHAYCCTACNELFYTNKKLKIHMKKFAHFSTEKPKYIEPLREYELYPDKISENPKKMTAQKENEFIKKSEQCDLTTKRPGTELTEEEPPPKKFKLSPRKVFLENEHSSTSMQDSAPEIKKELDIKSPNKHRKGKPYCKKCNKSFKDTSDLEHHKAAVHEDKPEVSTESSEPLSRESESSKALSHTCPVCNDSFTCSGELTRHLKMHVDEFPYKCSQCGKAFRLKIQLIQHVRLHISQESGSVTLSKSLPKTECQSLTAQNQSEAEIFKCHLCCKVFSFRYKLLNHLRLHTNVKCFQCYICHKAFATKHYLQRHLQVHIKQGMDVDIQNIIVDEESKTELDNIQIMKEKSQIKEDDLSEVDVLEKESLKRISVYEDKDVAKIESLQNAVNLIQVKAEVEESDSDSGHSFCSSLTRESDRSDPFRFSSDESNTFKSTMAKERRRLRRRWIRQSKKLARNIKILKCPVEEKSITVKEETEEDVTNMMVELNGVQSEMDNVMTVYVDLTQMKTVKNVDQGSETKSNLVCNELGLSPNTTVKVETQPDNVDDAVLSEVDGKNNDVPKDTNKKFKTLLFELDAEQLENNNFIIPSRLEAQSLEGDAVCDSDQKNITKFVFQTGDEVVKPIYSGNHPLKAQTSLSTQSQQTKSDPDVSNLDRLKQVFENSSKYLPLSQASSIPCYEPITPPKKTPTECKTLEFPSFEPHHNITESQDKHVFSPPQDLKPSAHVQHSAVHFDHSQRDTKSTLGPYELISPPKPLVIDIPATSPRTSSTPRSSSRDKPADTHSKTPTTPNLTHQTSSASPSQFSMTNTSSSTSYRSNTPISSSSSGYASHLPEHSNSQNTLQKIHNQRRPETQVVPLQAVNSTLKTSSSRPAMHYSDNSVYNHLSVSTSSSTSNRVNPVLPSSTQSFRVPSSQSGSNTHVSLASSSSAPVHMRLPSYTSPVHTSLSSSHTPVHVGLQSYSAPMHTSLSNSNANVHVSLQNYSTPMHTSLSNSNANVHVSLQNYSTPVHTSLSNSNANVHVSLQNYSTPMHTSLSNSNAPLHASLPSSFSTNVSSSNQNTFILNSSSIFDTNNPVLRDMNMMDLVNSTHATNHMYGHVDQINSQALPGSAFNLLQQSALDQQVRHNLMAMADAQGMSLQPQNAVLSVGNSLGINLGTFGNSFPSVFNQRLDPVGMGGAMDSSMISLASDDAAVYLRSLHESMTRSNPGNVGMYPPMSININQTGGAMPLNISNNFSLNSDSFGNFLPQGIDPQGSFSYGNIAALHGGLPVNISGAPQLMHNMAGPFPPGIVQDSLRNSSAPFGFNILNPAVLPGNGPITMISSFNPHFYPGFP